MPKRTAVLLAAAVAVRAAGVHAQAGSAPVLPAHADTAWSAVFRMDLDTARAVIAANHPGAVDARNPAFRRTLESAYREARAAAPGVNSYASYRIALSRFGNRFQDAHLNIGGTRPVAQLREAGLYPVYRGGAFVVREADERYGAQAAELRGAMVEACGGVPAARVFADRVLSWRGRPGVQADWHTYAPLLLVDYGPPTPPGPAECRFRAGGRAITLPLQWRDAAPQEVRARVLRVAALPVLRPALERMDGGRTLWVNVPSFYASADSEVAAMNALTDSLRAETERNRGWGVMVIDLRGNSGGSSVWADQVASAVFGKPWVDAARAYLRDGVYTEYRVSRDNVETARAAVRESEQRHGANSEAVADARALADSLAAALARGDALYGHAARRTGVPLPAPPAVPGRVVVVTTASCFSACLDFLDVVRLHPAIVQVGETTGVDTDYMENWGRPLPSGLSSIGYPMKVYRNRRRLNNQAYAPRVPYPGEIGDTGALRRWILAGYARW
ncbi:MAG TPA: S41 family peptidase [Longimicrobium sp.]